MAAHLKRNELINKTLVWLQERPGFWHTTSEVMAGVGVPDTVNQWYRNRVLRFLEAGGKIARFGNGKMRWKWIEPKEAQPGEQPGEQPAEQPGRGTKTIVAKFPGTCRKCGLGYSVGATLHQEKVDGQWRWVHTPNCPGELPAAATEQAATPVQQPAVAVDAALLAQVAALAKKVAELETARPPQVIELVRPDMPKVELKERSHPILEQVLFHINCGDNVMLVGPKGCGKTYLAQQIATLLGLEYGMISLSGGVTESKLFGRSTPDITTGKSVYTPAPFATMFENGGLYLLDEVDAADPNVLLSLNSGLANGVLPLDRPENPIANRHEKFTCMAAANTWGTGADRQYVGRNQQDGAFTERFVQIEMDYDAQLELDLNADQPELVRQLQAWRKNIVANKLERTISTRFICRAANWIRHGKDMNYVKQMLVGGWRKDELVKAGIA